jgi:transcriptional regulator GlxA family with amidase domain
MQRPNRAHPHLHLVRSPLRPKHGPHDAQVVRAIDVMNAQLDGAWTVRSLARRVGLSRPAFARRFRQYTGMSPKRYLTTRRMERAAALLSDSELSLAQVALAVGYASEFAFNRAFKRHHHLAPGIYRRRLAGGSRPVFRAAA